MSAILRHSFNEEMESMSSPRNPGGLGNCLNEYSAAEVMLCKFGV